MLHDVGALDVSAYYRGRLAYAQVMTGLRAVGCAVEPSRPSRPGSWIPAHHCPPIPVGQADDGFGLTV